MFDLFWRKEHIYNEAVTDLESGIIAAGEDDIVVDVNTFHSFVMTLLLPNLGQPFKIPNLHKTDQVLMDNKVFHLYTAVIETTVNSFIISFYT